MSDLYQKLHETYSAQRYDSTDVWAGHLRVRVAGSTYPATLACSYSDGSRSAVVEAEVYVRDVDWATSPGDLAARVWSDANDLGSVDERGRYHRSSGSYHTMSVRRDAEGRPVLAGNNLVLESEPIPLNTPGVFHYSVSLSADGHNASDETRRWISLNDIAYNQDGQIVVSHPGLRSWHSILEVCIRKVGARVRDGRFVSGKISCLTDRLDGIAEDVLHLLPFFSPGHFDLHTGEDVRKGELGSVYAPKDFFEIDPDLISSPDTVDLDDLVNSGLIQDADLDDLLDDRQRQRIRTVQELLAFSHWKELQDWIGTDVLLQMIGRAEMRVLVNTAHGLGKRVIFDLILMQTSRDCELIRKHPEWYVTDEEGHPAIHQIAWLVYSDVALLDLVFNNSLQNYLSGIAPFWIERCGFDGVRIDASQTIDRPFLKEIKNQIHRVKEDAIVLGETLRTLDESRDVPADVVYALFVDFHRDLNTATPLIDFVEETNRSFAPRTVALAYFENHDSIRATRVWLERYTGVLADDPGLAAFWSDLTGSTTPEIWMAQLKNLQASLINATIGNSCGTLTIYGVEWGTTWGSEIQTDFENPTLVVEDHRGETPSIYLQQAYASLNRTVRSSTALVGGKLCFHRPSDIGDPDDKLLVYSRRSADETMLLVHNLDHQWQRKAVIDLGTVSYANDITRDFDTLSFSISPGTKDLWEFLFNGSLRISVGPLQSTVLKLSK